ncbi:MAG: C45 family autoproteolytic acyltransferase/hydrolase, partial [Bacteroidetes bacterium]|nr:C45 family autoproteolytic acyltransferase/hydrolase [Bacteroidota bacterium]
MVADRKFRWIKRIALSLIALSALIAVFAVWFYFATQIKPPDPGNMESTQLIVERPAPDFYKIGPNWLKKSSSGLWEMYLEGTPFKRGIINGKLSKHLIAAQEKAFIEQIREMIPSDFYLRFLKYFIYWFNRNLDHHLTDEYKLEIYGISLSASEQYSFIGSNYQRILNYHSAHDIGHALQDYSLVGCTSFGVWGAMSKDSSLIIGRNFDFYAGDEFAQNKIVCFEKPDQGYGFMMVTWGGMIGTVSGMNEAGLTVTINAAQSEIPTSARTPISIVAREILQYASNISEAYAIAKKRETFVSESILIGSAKDKQAAIIEKSPFSLALVKPQNNYILCANHFQSPEFANDPVNIRNIAENASAYRFKRLKQDVINSAPMDYQSAAAILRDQQGLNGANIGMGNEKAMNQLIAHHSIIFMPEKLLVWVSTTPWQIGPYVCYDLYKIFHNFAGLQHQVELTESDKIISADSFLGSNDYASYMRFREMRKEMKQLFRTGKPFMLQGSYIDEFRASNPRYY